VCGICGVVQVGGDPRPVVSRETLDRMTDLMTHRGPNDRGTYLADGVALGVRRLSIIDVEGGHQPFANEDGQVWAIQNGELYNHPELRAELRAAGHRFASRCDTEVLPHLYERDGDALPAALRGKFGLAVWDGRRRRAVVARDRMGVKPIYFTRAGDLVVFASELKSVLASGLVDVELDIEAIDAYLTLGFFPASRTPLKHVSKLLPAHRLVVGEGDVRVERYWELPFPDGAGPELSEQEYGERLLAELDEAVRLRLMSDVPLGAMLSGGLDSSVVVALMARHASGPVKTFSVGFAEDVEGNELPDARLVASALGTDHHELELSFEQTAIPLEELVWHLDEPLADLSALGFHALSRLAAEHVTVALAGQGADELLGGYAAHRNAALARRWQPVPGPIRSLVSSVGAHGPRRLRKGFAVVSANDPVTRYLRQYEKLDPALRPLLVRGALGDLARPGAPAIVKSCLNGRRDDPLATTLYLLMQLGLVDDMLHYFDRASMASSLEVRVPFLDHKVVEFCASVPNGLKVRGLTGKHLLRRTARGLIPDRIIDKKKVGFFSLAIAGWFRAQTPGLIAHYLLQPSPAYAELLDRGAVEELVRGHASSSGPRRGNLLLAILMLELWLSTYLPRALRGAAPADGPVLVTG